MIERKKLFPTLDFERLEGFGAFFGGQVLGQLCSDVAAIRKMLEEKEKTVKNVIEPTDEEIKKYGG